MSEKPSPELISRRKALSMLGLVGALGLATSAVLPESEADAQETAPAPAAAPTTTTGGTPGMKRRRQQGAGRHERRHERRTGQPAEAAPAGTAPAGTPQPQ
jgi:hypothetical protein